MKISDEADTLGLTTTILAGTVTGADETVAPRPMYRMVAGITSAVTVVSVVCRIY